MPAKTRSSKRQTKLNFPSTTKFSPVAPTKPSPSGVAKSTLKSTTKPANRKASKIIIADSSSEDELQVDTETNRRGDIPVKAKSNGVFGSRKDDVPSDSPSSQNEVVEKPKVKGKSNGKKGDKSKKQEKAEPIARKRRRSSSSEKIGEAPEMAAQPRKRTRHPSPQKSDSEEDGPAPRSSKRRRVTKRESTLEESEQEATPLRSARRKASKRERAPEHEEVEQEAIPPRSMRRRLIRRPRNSDSGDNDERAELEEDLAFLESSLSSAKTKRKQERPRDRRQAALEALKKKRAGTQDPPPTPARKQRAVVDSESDSELDVIKEEPDSDMEQPDEEEEGSGDEDDDRDANALDMFQEDGDDAGFINDDPDSFIGEPSHADAQLPIQFSSLSRAKPKDLFKFVVEWMVMKKIHPSFNSTNDVYKLAFRKLEDEVQGLANSKFTSSSWKPEFVTAINTRPDLVMTEIGRSARDFMNDNCQACNRTNHPVSFELILSGRPYKKDTMESDIVDSDSVSDSDSDSDSDSSISGSDTDKDKNDDTVTFVLGRTCAANAQVSHTLHHWRYHLFQRIVGDLARDGHMTSEKVVKREKKSDRKREKEAKKIVDKIDVGKLYYLYKDQVRAAVEAQNEYRGRGMY